MPFVSGSLKNYIGDYGLLEGFKDILEGNFDPNQADNFVSHQSLDQASSQTEYKSFSKHMIRTLAYPHQVSAMDITEQY
eukprot:771210-Ditylum_brightwellii.AAC.1